MADYGDLSINLEDLTNGVSIEDSIVVGTGYLDKIMMTLNYHLRNEYESNRITGADYASVYLGMLQIALDKSVAILLSAKTSEQAAIAEAAKTALTEAQIAQLEYQTANILPEEVNKLQEEVSYIQSQDAELLANGLKDRLIKDEQIILVSNQAKAEAAKTALTEAQIDQVAYQTSNILPREVEKLEEEIDLLQSQDAELLATGAKDRLIKDSQYTLVTNQALVEAAKKLLVERQITGFDDDAAQKLVKMVLDTWSVAFSVSETAVSIPTSVTKDTIDSIFKHALDSLGIVKTTNPLG